MNEIELILQEKEHIFVSFLEMHAVLFLDRCTSEWVWKIWRDNGDTTIPFQTFKKNFLRPRSTNDVARKQYHYNGLTTTGPEIKVAENTRLSLVGWRWKSVGAGKIAPEVKSLLKFVIIPTSQRIQVLANCDPAANSFYRYLLEQTAKLYPEEKEKISLFLENISKPPDDLHAWAQANLDSKTLEGLEAVIREAAYQITTSMQDRIGDLISSQGADAVNEVRLPERKSDLKKWRVLWEKIRDKVEQGWNATDIAKDIQRDPREYKNLPIAQRTLQDVIKAGEAGLLEE